MIERPFFPAPLQKALIMTWVAVASHACTLLQQMFCLFTQTVTTTNAWFGSDVFSFDGPDNARGPAQTK